MKSMFDLFAFQESIKNGPMTRSLESDEVPEIERKENSLGPSHLRIGFYFLSDLLHQGEIGLQSSLLFREEIQESLEIGMKTALMEMDLKSGINVSNVMDGNEFDFFLDSDLFEKMIKLSTLLAPTQKGTCGIEGKVPSFERDHIPSYLFLLLKKKGVETFSGEKSSGRQPAHSGTDDNGIAGFDHGHVFPSLATKNISIAETFQSRRKCGVDQSRLRGATYRILNALSSSPFTWEGVFQNFSEIKKIITDSIWERN